MEIVAEPQYDARPDRCRRTGALFRGLLALIGKDGICGNGARHARQQAVQFSAFQVGLSKANTRLEITLFGKGILFWHCFQPVAISSVQIFRFTGALPNLQRKKWYARNTDGQL